MIQPVNPWDARFKEEYVYGTNTNVFLSGMESYFIPNGETLAIAEGEGRNAASSNEKGLKVTAWDDAPAGLEKTSH